jgi:hypothetical protein
MKTYIAFFDILGFKEIVKNESLSELNRRFNNLIRDSQLSLSDGKITQNEFNDFVPDSNQFKVNCIHISDSIIFWTKNNSQTAFHDIFSVARYFYRQSFSSHFIVRGSVAYDEIHFTPNRFENKDNFFFGNYSMIGKAIVSAYELGESLQLSACALHQSVLEQIDNAIIEDYLMKRDIVLYNTPVKNNGLEEYYLITPKDHDFNETSLENFSSRFQSKTIRGLYGQMMPIAVKLKLDNTINFFGDLTKMNSNT